MVVIAAHLLRPPKTTWEGLPISQTQVSEYAYVASVNNEVFHKPDCRCAKKISQRNPISFTPREDAIGSGRRPCKMCKL